MRAHWLSAVLIMGLLGVGLWMVSLDSDSSTRLLATRAQMVGGMLVVFLTIWRIVSVRRSTSPPPLDVGRGHQVLIKVIHRLQYATLIGLLLSGVALLALGDLGAVIAGDAPLPDLSELGPRKPHGLLSYIFMVLLAAHIGGSIIHQQQHGGTFQRIGLFRGSKSAKK